MLQLKKSTKEFLNNCDKWKPLSREQEKKASRDELVQHNIKYAAQVALGYANGDRTLDQGDLIQEANIGLIKAAERFDRSKKLRFITYANFWIRREISNFIINKKKQIRLPQNRHWQQMRAHKAGEESPFDMSFVDYDNEAYHIAHQDYQDMINDALEELTGNERTVFELWYKGRTRPQIAEETGFDKEHCDEILVRAFEILKDVL